MDEPIVHDSRVVKCGGQAFLRQPAPTRVYRVLASISRQRYAETVSRSWPRGSAGSRCRLCDPTRRRTGDRPCASCKRKPCRNTGVYVVLACPPTDAAFWGPGTTADGCDYYCRACRAILDKLRKRPRRRELAPRRLLAAPVPWRPGPARRGRRPLESYYRERGYFTPLTKKGIAMLPLPTEHDDKTFTYTQVEREGDIAIFCQAHKAYRSQRFEVVKIRVQPAHTWPNGPRARSAKRIPAATVGAPWGGRASPCRLRRPWHGHCGLPRSG